MEIFVCKNPAELGEAAAQAAARILNAAITANGSARLVLSTGNSQLTTLEALIRQDVDWQRVTLFHLDEYTGITPQHTASFQRYLREKFVEQVPLQAVHFVQPDPACIPALTRELRAAPVDLGLIGIGENGHIAFNDPPADFNTREAYHVVALDEACKRQQVGEGWFPNMQAVPETAISMTVYQIMQCRAIISCVPYAVKAAAIRDTLESVLSPMVPATMLKQHASITFFTDRDSFGLVNPARIVAPGQAVCEPVYC